MNKKALHRNTVVAIILILITVMILVAFIIRSQLSKVPSDEACHQAVVYRGSIAEATASGLSNLIQKEAVELIALKCKQNRLEIKSGKKEQVMKEIADEMARCWSMLGKGKVNFFGRALSERQQCLICSVINFKGDAKKLGKISTEDFMDFLKRTNIEGKEITYIDFFANSEEHLKNEVNYKEGTNTGKGVQFKSIDTGDEDGYAVVYTLWTADMFFNVALGGAAGIAAGVAGYYACQGASILLGFFTGGIVSVIGMIACDLAVSSIAFAKTYSFTSKGVDALRSSKYIGELYLVKYNPKELMSVGERGGKSEMACTSFEEIPD